MLSGSCMEMTAEKTAYLQYHIEKLLASDDIRQCRPLDVYKRQVVEGTGQREAQMFVELGAVFGEVFVLHQRVADAGVEVCLLYTSRCV